MIGAMEEERELGGDRIQEIVVKLSEGEKAEDFAIAVLRHYRMVMDDLALEVMKLGLYVKEATVRAGTGRQMVTNVYRRRMYTRRTEVWMGSSANLTEPVRPRQGDLRSKICTLRHIHPEKSRSCFQ